MNPIKVYYVISTIINPIKKNTLPSLLFFFVKNKYIYYKPIKKNNPIIKKT